MSFVMTTGNYDYLFTWYFYQDGSIEFNVKLTGILTVNLMAPGATPGGHGTPVFPQVNAQYHQHFFTLRLDPAVDGERNSVVMSDVVSEPLQDNPYGQAFTTRKTLLKNPKQAKTNILPEASRVWLITNPSKLNPYTGEPVSWKLMPWPSPRFQVRDWSPFYNLTEFLQHNTWVTSYEDGHLFPNRLPEWVEKNAGVKLDNEDVVLWHNFGVNHIPRTEDFPVMPIE